MRGASAGQEKKKAPGGLDDETIRRIGLYCKVEEGNLDSLVKYIRNRGIA